MTLVKMVLKHVAAIRFKFIENFCFDMSFLFSIKYEFEMIYKSYILLHRVPTLLEMDLYSLCCVLCNNPQLNYNDTECYPLMRNAALLGHFLILSPVASEGGICIIHVDI